MATRPTQKIVYVATLLTVAAFTAGLGVAAVAPVLLTQYGSLFSVNPQPVPDLSVGSPAIRLIPSPAPAPASTVASSPTLVVDQLALGLNPMSPGEEAESVIVTFGPHAMASTEFELIVAVNLTSEEGDSAVVESIYLDTPATLPGAIAVTLFYEVAPAGGEFTLNGMTLFVEPCASVGHCP